MAPKTVIKKNELTTLDILKNELQDYLVEGWKKLKQSESFKVYSEAFDFFNQVGLYEGLFRPQIPNPVYDNAAKAVGEIFLEKAFERGIYFKELFPGDFAISKEEARDKQEFRIFYLTAYQSQRKLAVFKITFEHTHDHFDFPSPPLLEICL